MVPIPLFRDDHNAAATTQKLLKVNTDSHIIRKQHPSPNNSGASKPPPHIRRQNRHPPVIIYTHSPRVIHTQPQDFMALVQKLTGYTPTSNDQLSQNQQQTKPVQDPRLSKPTISSYYNLDKYENKKSVMKALISNCFDTKVTVDDSNDTNSSNNTDESGCAGGGGSPGFFPPPIFDPRLVGPSASLPFFYPSFEDFCCPNNTNLMSNQTFFNNQISSCSGSRACFTYYNDASSLFDATSGMCLSSSSSSMEAAMKREF